LPTAGAPSPRGQATAVWTGRELIIWGGYDRGGALADGARYDPEADAWAPLPTANAPGLRSLDTIVWTGKELLIWGGFAGGRLSADGVRYDPVANTWRSMATEGAPSPRHWPSAVWTGSELIIWGGVVIGEDGRPREYLQDGARYDPANDTWTPMSNSGTRGRRTAQSAVSSGTAPLSVVPVQPRLRGRRSPCRRPVRRTRAVTTRLTPFASRRAWPVGEESVQPWVSRWRPAMPEPAANRQWRQP
jgi:N-acetylneuraminic acid mutarotase